MCLIQKPVSFKYEPATRRLIPKVFYANTRDFQVQTPQFKHANFWYSELFALCSLANGMRMSMGYAFHGCHQVFSPSF